jgi:hypothetical protein
LAQLGLDRPEQIPIDNCRLHVMHLLRPRVRRSLCGKPGLGYWDKSTDRYTVRNRTYKVARLVAEAFLGPSPFDGAIVLHVDEDSTNNRPSNLRWGTRRENCNSPKYLAYCRARWIGENNPNFKGRLKQHAAQMAA